MPKYQSFAHRFWSKVEIGGIDECWNWRGATGTGGYGQLNKTSKNDPLCGTAHRISWQLCFGKTLDTLEVGHRCANRLCVNPKHLYLTTRTENNREAMSRKMGRKYVYPAAISDDEIRAIKVMALSEQNGLAYPLVEIPRFMICGHPAQYVVSDGEGTSFCLFCAFLADHKQLEDIKNALL